MNEITTDNWMQLAEWGVVILVSLIAAVWDARTRRIPNRLTFSVLLAGFVWSVWTGGLLGLGEAFLACLVMAAPFVILFVFAGGGAGDAKLMGALGAWLGVVNGLVVLVSVIFAGALCGLAYAFAKKELTGVLDRVRTMGFGLALAMSPHAKARPNRPLAANADRMIAMPYGVAIFMGVSCAALGLSVWSF